MRNAMDRMHISSEWVLKVAEPFPGWTNAYGVPVFEPPLKTISVQARRLGARWAQPIAG